MPVRSGLTEEEHNKLEKRLSNYSTAFLNLLWIFSGTNQKEPDAFCLRSDATISVRTEYTNFYNFYIFEITNLSLKNK